MLPRRAFLSSIVALSVLLLAGPIPLALAQSTSDPVAAVKKFYDAAVKDEGRPISKRLKALYAAAQKKSKALGEVVSGLDFDPATGAQDNDDDMLKTIAYAVASRDATKALVVAALKVFKDQPATTINFELVLEGNAWKVDDIVNPAKTDGWRWSDMLKLGAKGQ